MSAKIADLIANSIEYRQQVAHVADGERRVEKLPLFLVTVT